MTVTHTSGGPSYRSIARVALGNGGAILARTGSGDTCQLTASQHRLLQSLAEFTTVAQLSQEFPLAAVELSTLAAAGLVESDAAVLARCAGLASDEVMAPITDLCILTCGKPQLLRRSVLSWSAFARHQRRELRITVVDDSPTPVLADAQRAAARALEAEAGMPLRFVDPLARSALAGELAQMAGVEPSLVEFAVSGRPQPRVGIGGSRNLAHLLTPGRRVLNADDDIIAGFAPPARHELALWITSEEVPMHTYFFASPDETEARVPVGPDPDALALHEAFVGHSVGSILARLDGPASLRGAGSALTAALQAGPVRVAAAALGLAGDSASDCLGFFSLLAGGETAQRVLDRQPPLAPSREVLRRPEFPVLCQGVYFMTFCHAVDHRLPLPPYFPIGRGEDQVWQKLLHWSLPDTVVAHLPLAVRHRPDGVRHYSRDDYLDPCRLFPGNAFLLGLLGTAPPPPPEAGADGRLAALGRHLADVAGNPAAFGSLVRGAWRAYLVHHQSLVAASQAARPRHPAWWQQCMRVVQERLKRRLERDTEIPLEYAGATDPAALEHLRQDVLRFSGLLHAWPALRLASADLARRRDPDPAWLRP